MTDGRLKETEEAGESSTSVDSLRFLKIREAAKNLLRKGKPDYDIDFPRCQRERPPRTKEYTK